MVTINTLDRVVGGFVVVIFGFGLYSMIHATFFAQPATGMMGMMARTDPLWYLFGTIITASIVAGIYLFSRDRLRQELTHRDRGVPHTDHPASGDESGLGRNEETPASPASPAVLDFLPEDERQVLEPILDTPGLTQVELRGRSDFSKAKVSQTVSELEARGLIYRERQGRTYKVYPGELLKDPTD